MFDYKKTSHGTYDGADGRINTWFKGYADRLLTNLKKFHKIDENGNIVEKKQEKDYSC